MKKTREIFSQIGILCREIQNHYQSPIINSNSLRNTLPFKSINLSDEEYVVFHAQCGLLLTFSMFIDKNPNLLNHSYLKEFWAIISDEVYQKVSNLAQDALKFPVTEFNLLNLTEAGYPLFLSVFKEQLQKIQGVVYTPQWIADEIVRFLFLLLEQPVHNFKSSTSNSIWYDPAAGMLNFEMALLKNLSKNDHFSDFSPERYYWTDLNPTALALGYFLLKEKSFLDNSQFSSISNNLLSSSAFHCESAVSAEAFDNITSFLKEKSGPLIIMGNPPYSVSSGNRNSWIVDLMRVYAVKEPNITRLYDDYVKFIRLAHKLIEVHGHGIIAYITNRKFLDGKIFYGMRQSLLNFFDSIYILDLFGDSRNVKEKYNSENVFGIQTGVAVCFFIKINSKSKSPQQNVIKYLPIHGSIEEMQQLLPKINLDSEFILVDPKSPQFLFLPSPPASPWQTIWDIGIPFPECFVNSSRAMLSGRDGFMIHVDQSPLEENVQNLENKNYAYLRLKGRIGKSTDALLENPEIYRRFNFEEMKKSIIPIVYRPFDDRYAIFYVINYRCGKSIILDHLNRAWDPPESIDLNDLHSSSHLGFNFVHSMQTPPFNHVLITRGVVDSGIFGYSTSKVAPLWYEGNLNLTEKFLKLIRDKKKDAILSELIGYLYGILSCEKLSQYFEPYLLHDFPRVIPPCCISFFDQISKCGRDLMRIHLMQFNDAENQWITNQLNLIAKQMLNNRLSNIQLELFKYNIPKGILSLSGTLADHSKICFSVSIQSESWSFKIGSISILAHWLQGRKYSSLERSWTEKEWQIFVSILLIVNKTIQIRQNIDKIFSEHENHFLK